MHYFKHSRDESFQDFCLFGDNFICHLLRQRQNALHSIAKARSHVVVLVLFLQELNESSSVTSVSDMPLASTNLKSDLGNTEDSLCNWIELLGVNFPLVLCGSRIAYLGEDSAIFNRPVHSLLYRSAHQWGVFL